MRGFPEKLFDTIQPMFPDTEYGFYGLATNQRDIWYTVKDGNWSDPSVWKTVGERRSDTPLSSAVLGGDDVNIRHAISMNTSAVFVNNLNISTGASFAWSSSQTFTVLGNIQCYGTVTIGSAGAVLTLWGNNNFINNFTTTTNSTVVYSRAGDQNIMNLPYWNLTFTAVSTRCTKWFTSNITVAGTFTTNSGSAASPATVECGGFDLSILGVTNIGSSSVLSKTGLGNVLFVGLITTTNGGSNMINFVNANVEVRGGITAQTTGVASIITGTGTWSFTTNNQNVNVSFGLHTFSGPVLISGAITLTITSAITDIQTSGLYGFINFADSVNGDNASSTLKNAGYILFSNVTPVIMTTGIFDNSTASTAIGYAMNGNFTLPLTSYKGLSITGTGIKTLGGTTTVANQLSIQSSGNLDMSTFDFSVTGTSKVINATITKSGTGNITFIGAFTIQAAVINFSGNPNVEFRNGFTTSGTLTMTSGTGTWKFSTNNQSITLGNVSSTFSGNILISGAITVTQINSGGATTMFVTGTLDGDNVASTFENQNTLNYQNTTAPMATNGLFKCNGVANTVIYGKGGAQDVQGGTTHLTTAQYWHLTLSVSGVKTQQGNISVLHTYTLSGTATKALNGFTFGNP